jgi:hypothetical protein
MRHVLYLVLLEAECGIDYGNAAAAVAEETERVQVRRVSAAHTWLLSRRYVDRPTRCAIDNMKRKSQAILLPWEDTIISLLPRPGESKTAVAHLCIDEDAFAR